MKYLPLLLVVLSLLGCREGSKPEPLPRQASLYERLGGEKAIRQVVDDFVAAVVDDPKIREKHRKHFMEGDVAGLKKKLVEQIGEATGGPQKYTGKNMKDAHKGLGITDADFDALVGDLVQALDRNKVPPAEKDALLKLLAPMRKDVVETPAEKP
jgi:hemoglobin